MDSVDITKTPVIRCQIARLFHGPQGHSETLIERASRALDALKGLAGRDDSEIGPWGRALLTVVFETLGEGERSRACRMQDGLDARGPAAATTTDREEAPTNAD